MFRLVRRQVRRKPIEHNQSKKESLFEDVSSFRIYFEISHENFPFFCIHILKVPHIDVEVVIGKLDLNILGSTTNSRYSVKQLHLAQKILEEKSKIIRFWIFLSVIISLHVYYSFRFMANRASNDVIACMSINVIRLGVKKMALTSRIEYMRKMFIYHTIWL